jgi:hypothetical protein
MKLSRTAAALVLLVLGLVAPLSAAEIAAAPARPAGIAAPGADILSAIFAAETTAIRFCPTYYCPIYPEYGCSCDWITCPDGSVACGVWNGTTATSASSVAPAASSPVLPRR